MTGPEDDGTPADPVDPHEALVRLKDRALSATAEGITIADARRQDRPLIYANSGFERLTGYPADDAVGRNCRFLQGEGTDRETVQTVRRAIEQAEACTVEILNYRKDGTPFWNRLSITPVRDDAGEVTHFIGVQSDVTARRRAEESLRTTKDQLEQALAELGKDLDMAARVQRSLLPEGVRPVRGLRTAWRFLPCTSLAGDSLNVLPLDDGRVALCVLDVSGHGVPAALLSATLARLISTVPGQSCLFGPAPDDGGLELAPPATVLRQLDDRHPRNASVTQYFTMVYGILDVTGRELVYAAGGQPGPIHVPAQGPPVPTPSTGHPVGLLPEPDFAEERLKLEPGDRLFFFTDGLPETFSPAGEEFGRDRLAATLAEGRGTELDASLDRLLETLRTWNQGAPFADDLSILAAEVE